MALRDGVLAGVAAARLWDAGRVSEHPGSQKARRDFLLCRNLSLHILERGIRAPNQIERVPSFYRPRLHIFCKEG